MSKLTNTAVSILTTAAAGAALMYLFDPEHGHDRRDRISDFATDKWSDLADKVSDLASSATHSARDLAHSASGDGLHGLHQHVNKLTGYVSDLASGLSSKLSDTAADAADYASDTKDSWYDSAANLAHRARKTARGYAGDYDLERHGVGTAAAVGAGGIGMLLLGAGLMYFLDPDHGRQRRSNAVDTLNNTVGGLGDLASKSGSYIRQRANGAYDSASDYASRIGGRMSSMTSGASDMIQKATDALNQASDAFRSIHIRMEDGKLVLDGTVPAAAYDRALPALESIPGIPDVINNLQVSEGAEH